MTTKKVEESNEKAAQTSRYIFLNRTYFKFLIITDRSIK